MRGSRQQHQGRRHLQRLRVPHRRLPHHRPPPRRLDQATADKERRFAIADVKSSAVGKPPLLEGKLATCPTLRSNQLALTTNRLPSESLKMAYVPQGCFCGGPSNSTPRPRRAL